MIASEERINDIFIMKRLSPSTSQKIMDDSNWPDDFKKFETLLRLGKELGHSVRFVDPISPSLVYTVIDLARARPKIEVEEISDLLQIGLEQTKLIVAEANKDTLVNIAI